jgi:predicted DNA-binding transcriptional regulator AlpA
MNGSRDDALASTGLGRVADLLEEAAREIRSFAGSSRGDLDPLGAHEAECRPPGSEPEATDPMPTPKPSLLLTQRQVAELLQVGTRTLARLRRDPRAKFPGPMKRARALRWRCKDIEAWLEMRR